MRLRKLAQGLTRDTFIGAEGTSLRPLDSRGRPMYLPPNTGSNALFLTTLRQMLVQDIDSDDDGTPDTLRLLYATPRDWLRDGATIRFDKAPTDFGPISISVKSNLSARNVTIDFTPPPRAPESTRVRLRLPQGWKLASASADQTIDLTAHRQPVHLVVSVMRGQAMRTGDTR